jgi:hypothetical protein
MMDTIAEGREAGRESGENLVKIMRAVFIAGLIRGILVLMAR